MDPENVLSLDMLTRLALLAIFCVMGYACVSFISGNFLFVLELCWLYVKDSFVALIRLSDGTALQVWLRYN